MAATSAAPGADTEDMSALDVLAPARPDPRPAPRTGPAPRTAPAPRPAAAPATPPAFDMSALGDLDVPVDRDPGAHVDDAPAAPAAAKPAAVGPDMSSLADLGSVVEREDAPEQPDAAPPHPASPAAAPPPALGGMDMSSLEGLGSVVEREEAVPETEASPDVSATASPTAFSGMPETPPAGPRPAPVARTAPSARPSAQPETGASDLDKIFLENAARLAPPSIGAEPGAHADPAAAAAAQGAQRDEAGNDAGADGTDAQAKAAPRAPLAIKPLRPAEELDPSRAFRGVGHDAQLIEAGLGALEPRDMESLELVKDWRRIDSGIRDRFDQASATAQDLHRRMEDLRAPAQQAGGGGGRGGSLVSIGRGLANMGRRGVMSVQRRQANGELDSLRQSYDEAAGSIVDRLFDVKSRHYEDRLGELDVGHDALNRAVGDYNKAFLEAPTAAEFRQAAEAYASGKGVSVDQAVADAASGKGGPALAAALAAVREATLADPAVSARQSAMREAEDAYSDIARRASKDFESLMRYADSKDGFKAEEEAEKLTGLLDKQAESLDAPLGEDPNKEALRERMRKMAEEIGAAVREMFEKLMQAVTSALGMRR